MIVLAAAEAAVALAIALNFYNSFNTIDVDQADQLARLGTHHGDLTENQ